MDSNPVLVARDLTKVFAGRAVVDGLNWTLPAGVSCALLGANGAGKTTTLRMAMGFTHPSRGRCELFGVDAWDPPPEIRSRVAYVSDLPTLPPWMRVNALIRFHSSFYPRWDLARERDLRGLFELPAHAKVASLSKGLHRRLALLLALCQRADLLLLDEPGSGLDVEVRRSFLAALGDYLAEEQRSVVFSTHLLTDVERIATHVLILHEGRAIEQCSLNELQEEVRVVTLSRDLFERTRETWVAAGLLSLALTDDGATLTVRNFRGDPEALAAKLPASSFESSALSIEDLYLALTRAGRKAVAC
jgi:ABC-2 type transport system ATP-binding protein